MGKHEKLLKAARNNVDGLSFEEFKTLLRQCNWEFDRQKGSHEIWFSPKRNRLPIQNRKGKAKGYQVKQFLAILNDEELNHG
jgi:predicted RNA binding protein YcfA (HicA-like mRNA interferase family)